MMIHQMREWTDLRGVWMLAASLFTGLVVEVTAGSVSEPVGIIRIDVESNETAHLSMPFVPFDGVISSVFENQLIGNAGEADADRLLLWDSNLQQYDIAYKSQNDVWLESGSTSVPALFEVTLGDGFFVENRHGPQTIIIPGKVVAETVAMKTLEPGFNLAGMPVSGSVPLNQTDLVDSGAIGGTSTALSDQLVDAAGTTNWLVNNAENPLDGSWITGTGIVSTVVLNAGEGFWYNRQGTNDLEWIEDNDLASLKTSANQPAVTGIVVTNGTVILVVDGTGHDLIELFRQDVATGENPAVDSGWELAEDSLTGGADIEWSESALTNVSIRIYVAAAQVDSDSDALSDAKETLLYKTDDTDADTDNDGADDGYEVLTSLTEPLDPDTDDDGMSDGSEIYFTGDPLASNAYAVLPYSETFDSLNDGSIDNQGGWQADSATVQSVTVLQGKAAELSATDSTESAIQTFGAFGHTNIWIDMYLKPQPGALPDEQGLTQRSAAVLATDTSGQLAGYDGIHQEWVTSSNAPSATGQWLRVTMGLDYALKTWRLNIDCVLAAKNLGFKDNETPELTHAAWKNSKLGAAHLDQVSVVYSEPEHLDDDNDALPNIWEKAQGLNAEDPADAAADVDGDGLTGTDEYTAGTKATDADSDEDGMIDGSELLFASDPTASNVFQQVPWNAGFEENEGYVPGALDGQHDWAIGTQGVVEVYAGDASTGTNSLVIKSVDPEVAAAEHWCVSATGAVVWTEFNLKSIPAPLPATLDVAGNSAIFMLETCGHFAAYDGLSQQWIVASNTPAVDYENWQLLTVRADYRDASWSLYWDNEPIISDIGFADFSLKQMVRFALKGGSSTGNGMDDLSVDTLKPQGIDQDADGRADIVEDVNQNNVVDAGETDPFNPDSDGDRMVDGAEVDFVFDPVVSNTLSVIPWSTGFESADGIIAGALDGQNEWVADGAVLVQSQDVYENNQAVVLESGENGSEAAKYFGGYPEKMVWFDSYAKLQKGQLPDPTSISSNASVLVAVNPEGLLCAWDSVATAWIPSELLFEIDPDEWTRITFCIDYHHKLWSAYIGNVRVFKEMPFSDQSMRYLVKIAMKQQPSSVYSGVGKWDRLALTTNEPVLLDNDGDGLPNAWELLHGVNPESSSDAMADTDNDGLANLSEYLAGTDGGKSDTDGDGFSDWMEVVQLRTDPLGDQCIRPIDCFSVNGRDFIEPIGCWETNGTSAYDMEGRGQISYSFNVRYPYMYYLEIQLGSHDTVFKVDKFDLRIALDDVYLGDYEVHLEDGVNGCLKLLLPFLPHGEHKITLFHNGMWQNRLLRIDQLDFRWIIGGDYDANGEPDWVENKLATDYGTASNEWSTHVSPFCLEGKGRYPEFITTSLDDLTMNKGVGDTWFRDIALLSAQDHLSFSVFYENGALEQINTISWSPYIMEHGAELHMRKGDMLKLALIDQCPSNQLVSIDVSTNVAVIAQSGNGNEAVLQFDVAGQCQITGSSDDGTAATIMVQVHDFVFAEMPICWQGKPRQWTLELDADNISLEHDAELTMNPLSTSNQTATFQLAMEEREAAVIVARIPSGSIVASTKAQGFTVFSSMQTGVAVVDELADGTDVIEMPVIIDPLPQDLVVRLEVFIAGVLFENGSTILNLTTDDFDELGRHTVRFLRAPGQESSACHYLEIYQNEIQVGKR